VVGASRFIPLGSSGNLLTAPIFRT